MNFPMEADRQKHEQNSELHTYLHVTFVAFLSPHAFLLKITLRSKSCVKFKVKAYASLHNDLYLQESHKQTARRDMSQFFPLLQ